MFEWIFNLLPQLPKEQTNRITILKGKLVNFAKTDDQKSLLLRWKNGKEEKLNGIDMTVGQKWSTVSKAFTIKSLSL